MPLTALSNTFIDSLDIGNQSRASALGLLIYDYPIDDFVIVSSTLAVQVILQLRVYALYQKSSRVRLFLICFWLLEVAAMVVFVGITFANIKAMPIIATSTGCTYTSIFSIAVLFWLPALAYELVLCFMVLRKVHEGRWFDLFWKKAPLVVDSDKEFNSGKLVKVLARDSLIYFVGVFIELVINTVIWSRYNRYIPAITPWSGALPSILGSRLFLGMREAILFPERYATEVGAAPSGVDAHSTVRFTATRRPVLAWMSDQTAVHIETHGTSAL
ncbi:hypothetical protein GSI_03450 [Ganoderma sinense ZZ0214-1]|uniref:Uncharacterized protein n=1 Tax=Ganoderma sinense ZZ0214-1 TaxID=1077348 RepID=A0A2G8SLP8_9APHY|nr:hypothetical protein GSI_03450 [Ganoderma sinense ZZ0214-1]